MTTVKVRPGDSIDKALRALKKRLDKEGVMKAVKAHRFYAKPSVKKRVKSKAAIKYPSLRLLDFMCSQHVTLTAFSIQPSANSRWLADP